MESSKEKAPNSNNQKGGYTYLMPYFFRIGIGITDL